MAVASLTADETAPGPPGDGRPEFVLNPGGSESLPDVIRPRATRRHGRLLSFVLVVATVAVPVGLRAWARVGDPSDGALSAPSSPRWQTEGVTLGRVERSAGGLREGDVVTAVNGIPLETWVRGRDGSDAARATRPRPGDRLTYTILRDGSRSEVDVVLRRYDLRDAVAGNAGAFPLVVLVMGVAVFVYLTRPRDRAAHVLLGIAALIALGVGAAPYVQVVDLLDMQEVWLYAGERVAVALMWGALFHFALIFPEPWTSPRRRRRLIALGYAGPFLLYGAYLAITLPTADGRLAQVSRLISVSYLSSRTYPVVVAALIILAYRSALSPEDRQRLRWVMVTFVAAVTLFMAIGQVPSLLFDRPFLSERWLALLFLPCPVVVGGAILRYRLFDVEVILKRSLVYGVLTAGLFGLYFVALGLATVLLGTSGAVVPLFASALVAVCVPALRDRLRGRVSRLVYGDRDDPQEVISRLGRRVEGAPGAEGILPAVVETLTLALRLPYVAVELRSPDGEVEVSAEYGRSAGNPLVIGLAHRGEMVGRLLLEAPARVEPFGPADRRLLEDVGRFVASSAHEVLMQRALQRSLERVVLAREEERRRLRRDLHDGLGPTLAAGALQLTVARNLVRDDAGTAEAVIDRVTTGIQGAIAEVRGLVRGLRPARLDELGLVDALRQRATDLGAAAGGNIGAVEVHVDATGDFQSLPAAVEVAAYRIVTEALNNAVRHGQASHCTVRLVAGDALVVRVEDDGRGMPDHLHPGVGLSSMRDRASELGGAVEIGPAPAGGTVIEASLPIDLARTERS